jgi:hypothetical protein
MLCAIRRQESALSGCPRITLEFCGAAVPAAQAGETPAPQVILGQTLAEFPSFGETASLIVRNGSREADIADKG